MFESIVVRTATSDGRHLDIGLLAETIFFYGQVHLLIDRPMLGALTNNLGTGTVLRVLRSGYVRGTFIRDLPAIVSKGPPQRRLHTSSQIRLAGTKEIKKPKWAAEDDIRTVLQDQKVRPSIAKRFARMALLVVVIFPRCLLRNSERGLICSVRLD